MFVWQEDDWYQTNGADGLPIITDDGNAPDVGYVVPGQFWYDKLNNNLYIWAGELAPDGANIWRLLADLDQDFLQTTATLPLSVIGPRIQAASVTDDLNYLPTDDPSLFTVQKDYNEFLFAYLVNLDKGLTDLDPVYVSDTPPAQAE